jgi:riboflavin synthase
MFTGIVDHCGVLSVIEQQSQAMRLKIKHNFEAIVLGESIAVDGICLTVTGEEKDVFFCDLSPETMTVTTARYFKEGQKVNLERALQPLSRIGGHFVTGHIDRIGSVKTIQKQGDFIEMVFVSPKEYIFPKGSIAINGVSLTVNQVDDESFAVMLIPHTLERTNLSTLQMGDEVNLEFDMMARVIVEQYKRYL